MTDVVFVVLTIAVFVVLGLAVNAAGLVVVAGLVVFMVAPLLFPERF